MEKFTIHSGIVAGLDRANVDTDAIMPKQYLKCIFKSGYGDWAFDDWRYLDPGDVETDIKQRRLNPDFELNQTKFNHASILLSRQNFGCGSSREHAVWGIRDMGFKVIIASSFADIFYNNCFNNGVLAVTLSEQQIQQLFEWLDNSNSAKTLDINLESLNISGEGLVDIPFTLEQKRRHRLLNGLDAVAETLQKRDKISAFEQRHKQQRPYFFNALN